MTIRPATLLDVPRVVTLAHEFWTSSAYARLGAFDVDRVTDAAVRMIEDLGVILVAEVEGRVEGLVAAIVMQHEVTFEWYLNEWIWWVEPAHRRSTIGPRLEEALEAWALQREIYVLRMVEPAEVPDVGTFYLRRGFEMLESVWIKRLR